VSEAQFEINYDRNLVRGRFESNGIKVDAAPDIKGHASFNLGSMLEGKSMPRASAEVYMGTPTITAYGEMFMAGVLHNVSAQAVISGMLSSVSNDKNLTHGMGFGFVDDQNLSYSSTVSKEARNACPRLLSSVSLSQMSQTHP